MFNSSQPIKSKLLEVLETDEGQKAAEAFRNEFFQSYDLGKSWEKLQLEADHQGIGTKVKLALADDLLTVGVPLISAIIRFIMTEMNRKR